MSSVLRFLYRGPLESCNYGCVYCPFAKKVDSRADLAKDRVVVLSTHVVEDIGSSCREVVVLDRGRILFRGTPAELTERARGRAWIAEIDEAALPALQRASRVVSTTRMASGRVVVRGVGEPPAGAVAAEPSLEDAYLLLLGRTTRELPDVA